MLLEHDANVNCSTKNGFTPLYKARRKGNISIVQLLLEYGSEVNHYKDVRNSPLYVACEKEFIGILKLLLNNRADDNVCGIESCLTVANENGHVGIVKLLQE